MSDYSFYQSKQSTEGWSVPWPRRLSLSDAGLQRRELMVLDTVLGRGIPLAGFVGGGYHKDLTVLASRHCALHRAADVMWRDHGL